MKSVYFEKLDEAHASICDLVQPGELTRFWTITRINVPRAYRGLGHGNRLLVQVITDADADGVALALEPSPSGPLDYEALVAWYRRHGFEMHQYGYMVRRPVVRN